MNNESAPNEDDDLLNHYDIDFSKAKRNPYAAKFGTLKPGGRVIYLDPEVAERFETSEEVNRVLRTLVEVMPPAKSVRKPRTAKVRVKATKSSKKAAIH